MIGKLVAAGAALGVGALFLVPVLAVSSMSAESTLASSPQPPACSSSPDVKVVSASLDTAQLLNASDILSAAGTVPRVGVRGAIVGVAVGLDESDLSDEANNAVPASLAIPHQGLSADHDSIGVFQQRVSQGWGSVAEIMDVTASAETFYHRLVALPGWSQLPAGLSQQQTDTLDGQAAQAIQRSGDPSGGNYAAMVPLATQIVSSAIPVGATLDSCVAPVTISGKAKLPAAVVAAIRRAPAAAQQSVSYALAQIGKPYLWGGIGPIAYDCSGLVMEAWLSAGAVIPRTSEAQAADQEMPEVTRAQLRPGDLVFPFQDESHVVLYLGGNMVVQAPQTGQVIDVQPFYGMAGGARRIVTA